MARNKKSGVKHGNAIHCMSNTKTYYSWSDMKKRCFNKNCADYARYGARGITVCDKWLTFAGFYEDMGKCPDGLTLDRKDNNGNYDKSNCRWAAQSMQANNRSSNVLITYNGETRSISEWSRIVGICHAAMKYRFMHWTIDEAITRASK